MYIVHFVQSAVYCYCSLCSLPLTKPFFSFIIFCLVKPFVTGEKITKEDDFNAYTVVGKPCFDNYVCFSHNLWEKCGIYN